MLILTFVMSVGDRRSLESQGACETLGISKSVPVTYKMYLPRLRAKWGVPPSLVRLSVLSLWEA